MQRITKLTVRGTKKIPQKLLRELKKYGKVSKTETVLEQIKFKLKIHKPYLHVQKSWLGGNIFLQYVEKGYTHFNDRGQFLLAILGEKVCVFRAHSLNPTRGDYWEVPKEAFFRIYPGSTGHDFPGKAGRTIRRLGTNILLHVQSKLETDAIRDMRFWPLQKKLKEGG